MKIAVFDTAEEAQAFNAIAKQVTEAKTKEQARDAAIAWQQWSGEQDLSFGELAEWQSHFRTLARRFNLRDEFEENGII